MTYRILNIAEKPSVARKASEILSGGSYQKGFYYSKYNPIFRFTMPPNSMVDTDKEVEMIFSSVAGHILQIDYPEGVRSNWYSVPLDKLFDIPIVKFVNPSLSDVNRNLQKLAREATHLLLWLDCDREGENISFEVIDICRKANPNIMVKRAIFAALSREDILNAYYNPGDPNKLDSDAVDARMEIDLRTGVVYTRFQTIFLRKKFGSEINTTVSFGTCQLPTLGFVVERYRSRREFVPEDFWKMKAIFKNKSSETTFKWERGRIFDEYIANVYYEKVNDPSNTVRVLDVQRKRETRQKPYPLNTVEFQKKVSKVLRINSSKAMEVAESLYQQGFISYPRTETNAFPMNMDLQKIISSINQEPYSNYISTMVFDSPRRGIVSDNSHPPIYPIRPYTGPDLLSRRVYDFVARHFLAACSKSAVGERTLIKISIGDEVFTAKGLRIIERNYLDIYEPFDFWKSKFLDMDCEKGQILKFPDVVALDRDKTRPPELLTEPDLIQLMDKNGIGTDATIAEHILKIQERGYTTLEKAGRATKRDVFIPTKLGLALVDFYSSFDVDLSKPYHRRNLEMSLVQVSKGEKTKDMVVAETIEIFRGMFFRITENLSVFYGKFSEYFQASSSGAGPNQAQSAGDLYSSFYGGAQSGTNMARLTVDNTELIREFLIFTSKRVLYVDTCPNCRSGQLFLSRTKNGKYNIKCSNCPYIMWMPAGTREVEIIPDKICPSCGARLVNIETRFRSDKRVCLRCDELLREEIRISVQQPRKYTAQRGGRSNQKATQRRAPAAETGNAAAQRARKQGAKSKKVRKCSICGQPGHDKRTCPRRK